MPLSIQTQGSTARLLQEGVNAVATFTYDELPNEAVHIFGEMHNSEKEYEIDVSLSGIGLAARKPECTAVGYDSFQQDWTPTYVHSV